MMAQRGATPAPFFSLARAAWIPTLVIWHADAVASPGSRARGAPSTRWRWPRAGGCALARSGEKRSHEQEARAARLAPKLFFHDSRLCEDAACGLDMIKLAIGAAPVRRLSQIWPARRCHSPFAVERRLSALGTQWSNERTSSMSKEPAWHPAPRHPSRRRRCAHLS